MPDEMMQYLPAIYQVADEHSLLAHLLAAFESILLKRVHSDSGRRPAIEELVADLARHFDPRPGRASADFLPWLAGWTALSLRADLSEARLREVIAGIVPLYARRGTRRGIIETVRLFTGGTAEIHEPEDLEFQIHDHSTIGKETYLGGPPPHMFRVRFIPAEDPSAKMEDRQKRWPLDMEIARSVIEMTKPAHTTYILEGAHREPSGQPGHGRKEEVYELPGP